MKAICETQNIRISKSENSNVLANASLKLTDGKDDFVIHNLTVMNSKKGLFVNMPAIKGKDSEGNVKYYDAAYPMSNDLRKSITDAVLAAYKQKVNEMSNGQTQDNEKSAPAPEANEAEQDDDELEMF